MYGYVTYHNFCTVNHTFILDTTIRKQKSISYIYIIYIFKEICFCTVTVGVFSMLQMATGYWNRVYTMKFQAHSTLAQHPAIWHIAHEGNMPYLKLTTTGSFIILPDGVCVHSKLPKAKSDWLHPIATCVHSNQNVTHIRPFICYVRPLKSTGYTIGILMPIKKQFLIPVIPSKWHKLHSIVTNYARPLKSTGYIQ